MATLKYWDGTQWVVIASGGGDYVRRAGDLMTGPLVMIADDSDDPTAILLNVAGQAQVSSLGASAGQIDALKVDDLTIAAGAQRGYVWTATDEEGHGAWVPLTDITPVAPAVHVSDTEPSFPDLGLAWWDTSQVDADYFAVEALGIGGATHAIQATGGYVDIAGYPQIAVDIPCEGLLKVMVRGLMKAPTNAGCGYALVVASQENLTATTVVTPEARIASSGTAEALAIGNGLYEVTNVDPSGGKVIFTQRELATTGTACTLRYPQAYFEFIPRGNRRHARVTWTASA